MRPVDIGDGDLHTPVVGSTRLLQVEKYDLRSELRIIQVCPTHGVA